MRRRDTNLKRLVHLSRIAFTVGVGLLLLGLGLVLCIGA